MTAKLSYDELRTVFDACDPSRSGYISFDDFAGLARQYGDQNEHLLQDAEHFIEDKYSRRLSFSEFSRIVEKMFRNKDELGAEPVRNVASHSIQPSIHISTYTEVKVNSAGVGNEGAHSAAVASSATNGDAPHTHTHMNANKRELALSEDSYEDFGDGDASVFGRNATIRGTWPIHRVANLPESPSGSMHRVLSQSISPRGAAAQSRRSSRAPSEVHSGSALHDELIDNLDSNFDALNDKMQVLQHQVEQLTKSQEKSESKSIQLKLENQRLTDRVNLLEEQLQDSRARSEQELLTERQRYRDLQVKYDRDMVDQAELTKNRIQLLEASCNDLRNDYASHRAQNERLKSEVQKLELDLKETKINHDKLASEHSICTNKISKLQKQTKEQKQEMNEINGELEMYRARDRVTESTYSLNSSINATLDGSLSSAFTTGSVDTLVSRISELEQQAKRLTDENRSLKERNEELQDSILSGSFDRGRMSIFKHCIEQQNGESGLHDDTKYNEERSLAAELEQLNEQSREEPQSNILEQLVKEKEANQKLRQYVDDIILKVLEKHPEILEKK